MRLRLTAEALGHLSNIRNYLNERNPTVARRVLRDIQSSARRLREFPHLGRAGPWPDTRIWVVQHSPYLIVYRPDHEIGEVVVLAIVHGRQDWERRR